MDELDFNNFSWHSAVVPDENMLYNKKIKTLKASKENLENFSLF
jgi:hypothetical protein